MMTTRIVALQIDNVEVRQDADGRYCLNDLHQAAGGEKRHQPSNWLQVAQTQELLAEIEKSIPGIPGIRAKQGLGTFVAKELVYAYAMWISPVFHLKVIRTFDAAHSSPQTTGDALVQMALAYKAHETRLMAIEAEQTKTRQAIAELVGGEDYATAKGFARTQGLPGDRATLAKVGKWASQVMRARGLAPGKVHDEAWGEVNSYPRGVLRAAFDAVM